MSRAYYNEIDKFCAQWLRNLIAAGHIAPGDVDERSIEDVRPDDLRGYTQCHFFAGIGVWSYALRLAGWSDDRSVWTGSCPCQPFSAAGKGAGFADERHLWPAWEWLIKECRPSEILGEQVASKDADPWIDLVQDDLEALGYAVGAVPFPSAGVGAPHIRDRLYWVGVGLADANHPRLEGRNLSAKRPVELPTRASCMASGMAHSNNAERRQSRQPEGIVIDADTGAGPTNGFWRDADWLGCTDGRFRPVEPGSFPLADGIANRMDKLRAYGNAINAYAAAEFIMAAA